jgi:hypothetical protein
MMKLVDMIDSKSIVEIHAGSNPAGSITYAILLYGFDARSLLHKYVGDITQLVRVLVCHQLSIDFNGILQHAILNKSYEL